MLYKGYTTVVRWGLHGQLTKRVGSSPHLVRSNGSNSLHSTVRGVFPEGPFGSWRSGVKSGDNKLGHHSASSFSPLLSLQVLGVHVSRLRKPCSRNAVFSQGPQLCAGSSYSRCLVCKVTLRWLEPLCPLDLWPKGSYQYCDKSSFITHNPIFAEQTCPYQLGCTFSGVPCS